MFVKPTLTLSVSALALGATQASAETPDAWSLLSSIEREEIITDTTYEVRKIFPAEVANGIERFDITGYVVPLSEGTDISDLILISDIGFCPFCGSPEHGTSLQVTMATPVQGLEEGARVTLRGQLEPITDPETWQTTIMRNAEIIGG